MSNLSNYTLSDIAKLIDAEIDGNPEEMIHGLAPIAIAQPGQLTYFIGGKYRKFLDDTKASAVILSGTDAKDCHTAKLIVANPEVGFAKVAKLFSHEPEYKPGVHSSAIVGISCNIDPNATIGANCVIGSHVTIGRQTRILPGTVIEDGVTIGASCIVHPNVTIYHNVTIGDRVRIHSGATIGADGFGFAQNSGQWEKIPQLGSVVIHDDVDIGAGTCVDRGALQDTVIGRGVKLDNLVQVGHNVSIGAHTIICGCVGIAGSVSIGEQCMIGGGCNINGHVNITNHVALAGASTVKDDITEANVYASAIDVKPFREWGKTVIKIRSLDKMDKRIKRLEKACYENCDDD